MRKEIVVALAVLAMGLAGLFAAPAKGLQFGFNTGYSSVGFQLHGMGGEFLFGFQGQDEHRPQGSVLRIGLAGAAGSGETNLAKAKWSGQNYDGFRIGIQNAAAGVAEEGIAEGGVQAAKDQVISNFGLTETFDAVTYSISTGANVKQAQVCMAGASLRLKFQNCFRGRGVFGGHAMKEKGSLRMPTANSSPQPQ